MATKIYLRDRFWAKVVNVIINNFMTKQYAEKINMIILQGMSHDGPYIRRENDQDF